MTSGLIHSGRNAFNLFLYFCLKRLIKKIPTLSKLDLWEIGKGCLNYLIIVITFDWYFAINTNKMSSKIDKNHQGTHSERVYPPWSEIIIYKSYEKENRSWYYQVLFFADYFHIFWASIKHKQLIKNKIMKIRI